MRRIRRRNRAGHPAVQQAAAAAMQARHDAVLRVQQELGGALERAKSVMNEALDRGGMAGKGESPPVLLAVARSRRAVNDALGQLSRANAAGGETAKAVADAAQLATNAVSAGIGAEQRSLQAAHEGVAAALQATATAVAEAGKIISGALPKAATPPKAG